MIEKACGMLWHCERGGSTAIVSAANAEMLCAKGDRRIDVDQTRQ